MKCCICGAVKNVAVYLDRVFDNMEKIGTLFDDYLIILCYDPSGDDTLQKIKDYQIKNPRVIFYANKSEISRYRTHRIAFARNRCLDMIRVNYSDYEMFIMMDCDDVCSGNINLDVLNFYLHKNSWDALSFNKNFYYDVWALSVKPYMLSYRVYDENATAVCKKMQEYIQSLLSKVEKNGLLKCASAFNGFAIYRTNMFINCNYNGYPRNDLIKKIYNIGYPIKKFIQTEDCEHRAFHFEAINNNGSRIRISPKILFS